MTPAIIAASRLASPLPPTLEWGMATRQQKDRWAIVVAFSVATAFTLCTRDRWHGPTGGHARLVFVAFWAAGGACAPLWGYFTLLASLKMRKPGVPWWMGNTYRYSADIYTNEGVCVLRKARIFFIAWLSFWAIGAAIAFASGMMHQGPA